MMADSNAYESVVCVKSEVHVYRIPPRSSNRGYRAADWKLEEPAWSGRMKITAKGKTAFIKLEDKNTGELFAQAPIEEYPGIAVEAVTDSSRYFVIRIEDGNGRHAFIGIGFADRGDSFDFNVALQDHFKWVKQESEFAKQEANLDLGPKLDLGFKEGQTIKINIGNIKKKDSSGPAKSRAVGGGLLPPPPGVKSCAPSPIAQQTAPIAQQTAPIAQQTAPIAQQTAPIAQQTAPIAQQTAPIAQQTASIAQQTAPIAQQTAPIAQTSTGMLLDFGDSAPVSSPPQDLWGDFTAAGTGLTQDSVRSEWVQF